MSQQNTTPETEPESTSQVSALQELAPTQELASMQEPAPTRRVFKYGDKAFYPGDEYTPEQVLEHLKGYFPELANASIDEKQLEDGTLEITFSKQVTTKG